VKNVAGFDVTRLCLGSWGSLGLITSVSARLFPIPEADTTLVFRGRDAQALLSPARDMALSSLPLASVELLDSLTLEAEGAGPSPALVLRIMGSQEQATAMADRVRGELRREAGDPRILENEESQSFHKTMDSWESGAALVLRISALPSKMDSLMEEAETLRGLISGDGSSVSEVRYSANVSSGVLRVAAFGQGGGIGSLASWTSALTALREKLESAGGSLTISCGPADLMRDVGAWGTRGGEWEIMSGLKAEFDPGGILAPGRLGL
jgi:glycolate oxidase FAD binding subunit